MAETMIERVARAVWEDQGWHHYTDIEDASTRVNHKWEDLPEDEKAIAHCEARAAIEAMREPTQEMRGAVVKAEEPPGGFTRGYQAMIDAALKEKVDSVEGLSA